MADKSPIVEALDENTKSIKELQKCLGENTKTTKELVKLLVVIKELKHKKES